MKLSMSMFASRADLEAAQKKQDAEIGMSTDKASRTYPYKAWVLMPSFKPVEVELVKNYGSWSSHDYGDLTATGKNYHTSNLHKTKADAIAAGLAQIEATQADIEKRILNLNKKRAAIAKAEQL